ncbi:MAG: 30S ribosomal protein S16 [Desulfobacteraceae bacterium]|nr:MAG: 30S ribosomal protein S16 [Desulfobacteraceae bacterium]
MSVKIRLTRMGTKKKPFYRLVAANSEAPRDGKFLEILGTYDPTKNPAAIKLNKEKVSSWLQKGAGVTESARAILKNEGLI